MARLKTSRRRFVTALAGLTSAFGAGRLAAAPEKPPKILVDITRQSLNLLQPTVPVPIRAVPLRDAPLPSRPAAAVAESPLFTRHFGSNACNGRLPARLGRGGWALRWAIDLPADPVSIVRARARIVCQWPGSWRLLMANGQMVQEDYVGQSPVVIDDTGNAFQLMTATSSWEVRRLDNGEIAFQNALPYDENYAWPILYRSGSRMIAFASIRPAFRHGSQGSGAALLQMIEVGTPMRVDASKLVENLTRFEVLHIGAEGAVAAASGETVVIATPGLLLRFDTQLELTATFSGSFVPRQLALDEAGWMHLVVDSDETKALWIVTPTGGIACRVALGRGFGDAVQPPLVGVDRRVYLLSSNQLIAIDAQGRQAWSRELPSPVGAGVTLDGQLLLCVGRTLQVVDPTGQAVLLHTFAETLTTPPVFTADQEILVGAQRKLYCLRRA